MSNPRLPFCLLILCFLCLGVEGIQAQDRVVVSGYISDADSGERLIGASVYVKALKIGTVSNRYGFFSLMVPKDSLILVISFVGYKSRFWAVKPSKDFQIAATLTPESASGSVEITTQRRSGVEATETSTIEIPIHQIKALPALMGETDVIKVLQLMPGVQSGSEGSTGLYVRGGGPDQNLILVDDTPVYNVSHLFGFFSVFNSDAIQSVTLSKGGFPARYGGRLSSVVDIALREGHLREWKTEGSLGIVAAKWAVQGPILRDKMSLFVSVRRTYIDALARPILRRLSADDADREVESGYYFYDLNAKWNWIPSSKDRLFMSWYSGKDAFHLDQKQLFNQRRNETRLQVGMDWGNVAASFRWNHLFNNRLFANTAISLSQYVLNAEYAESDYALQTPQNLNAYAAQYSSGIRDWRLKTDWDWSVHPRHAIRFGAVATRHRFVPAVAQVSIQEGTSSPFETEFKPQAETIFSTETALFAEDDWQVSEKLRINGGVHMAGYWVDKQGFFSIQPRISARLKVGPYALKASFAQVQQPLHLLTTSSIGLPTDLWLPATEKVPPSEATQSAIGVVREWSGWEATIEAYYKPMKGIVEYKPGANFVNQPALDWQEKVASGNGLSRGIEFFLQKTSGRTMGWVGYSLARSTRTFKDLNEGKPFPYRYDRLHDVVLMLQHKLTAHIEFSGTWVYGTGNALTLAISQVAGANRPWESGTLYTYYGSRNGYRMSPYHRMDLGANFNKNLKIKGMGSLSRTISASFYNVYNRKNAFFIYEGEDPVTLRKSFRQASLFPIIPSIAYAFRF